jgi:hypothetical protein
MKCSPRKEMAMGMMYGGEAKKPVKKWLKADVL